MKAVKKIVRPVRRSVGYIEKRNTTNSSDFRLECCINDMLCRHHESMKATKKKKLFAF